MSKKEDFVHLHVHSDMSQLDGCGKMSDYVAKAKELGQPAVSMTEHGTMRGYLQLNEECEAHGIKPIFGVEFYVSNDMMRKGLTDSEKADIGRGLSKTDAKAATKEYEERNGIRDRWHITVWAKNNVGLANLFELTSAAWIDGFYYKPRIDLKKLIACKEGLMVATGCMSSVVNDRALGGKKKLAIETAELLREHFGEDLWIEVQAHDMYEQTVANDFALELKKRWGAHARLLATQDAHYVDIDDHKHHEVLLCIGTNGMMSDPNRFKFDVTGFHFKTREEMRDAFKKYQPNFNDELIKEALDNTVLFSEAVETKLEIDRFKCLLPPVDIPEVFGGNEFAYLVELCKAGWEWREVPERAKALADRDGITHKESIRRYTDRLKLELRAIKKQKYVGYFLVVHDLYDWARKNNFMCGPGRGSAAGSMVSWLAGITSVDPIEHGLLFERFISPARIDMPDIDMDFEDVRRQEIIQYLRDKYGHDKVAQIATVGKLSGKQCLKDVARVLGVPYAEVNQVTNSIIERSSGDERASQTIEDSFKEFKVCREFNAKYPDVLKHARKLEGMAKNLGIHAAGVVASPVPLKSMVPLEVRKQPGSKPDVVVTAVDMYGVQDVGLLKLDVLGLRTLTVLREALDAIEEHTGERIDMETVSLNVKKVLDLFTAHDYVGIFQYDSAGADKICAGVKFENFEDVAAMTALNRPGTARSGLASQYVARKKNPKLVKKTAFHPKVDEITKDTLGIIVYQEHVIRIFTEIAGFAPGTADSLRKKIAKKFGDEIIGKEREKFIAGAMKHTPGMTEQIAGKLMDAITFFGCLDEKEPLLVFRDGRTRHRPIADLVVGDIIQSEDENGELVLNKVKRIQCTGEKDVLRLVTEVGDSIASSDHWWKMGDGSYAKTSQLAPGDELSYPTGLNTIGGEDELQRVKVSTKSVLQRNVFHTLSKRIQEASNNPRQSCGFNAQQIGQCNWQGVEKGVDQRTSINIGAIESHFRKEQPSMERWARSSVQNSQRINGYVRPVPTVRQISATRTSSAKHEGASRSSQKQKQERQQAREFTVGVPSVPFKRTLVGEIQQRFPRVIDVKPAGRSITWDIECENAPHNYVLANGLTCHNSYGFNKSHATAYGIIAYWGMYLKCYYPLEFYWALLKNEPDRINVQRIAKDAKKHGIEILPPDVSISKRSFSIDRTHNAIRGSLVDIKGVGSAAATSIMENQPYEDFMAFLNGVNRRKVHKGVAVALAKSGALDDLLPNAKWFVENVEVFWKQLAKGTKESKVEVSRMLKDSAVLEGYTDEERVLVAAQVSPLAFGKHPVDAYSDFIKHHADLPYANMSDGDFYKQYHNKGCYVIGIIVEIKYNQVGDFHTGELPSEAERVRMGWGKRYANVNVEDPGGTQNRIKVDWDIFDTFREVIDAGHGTPVIVHASVNARYENMRAHFLINVEQYRANVKNGVELNDWERIISNHHPAVDQKWKNHKIKELRLTNTLFKDAMSKHPAFECSYCGVVTHVRAKLDKNDNEMGFFGLLGADHHYIDVVCFGSTWPDAKDIVKPGRLLVVNIDHNKGGNFYSGGKLRWLRSS